MAEKPKLKLRRGNGSAADASVPPVVEEVFARSRVRSDSTVRLRGDSPKLKQIRRVVGAASASPSVPRFGGFADMLASRGLLDEAALAQARSFAASRRQPIEKVVLQERMVDPESFALAAADYLGMPPMRLGSAVRLRRDLFPNEDIEFWRRVKAIPVSRFGGRTLVAFGDPFDLPSREQVEHLLHDAVWSCVAPESDVLGALNRYKQLVDAENPELQMEAILKGAEEGFEFVAEELEEAIDASVIGEDEAPIIRIVNAIMTEAMKTGASDVHLEALEKETRLRYRIDGKLVRRPAPSKSIHNAVVSRIKIMSNLDIAERRKPQDGRFKLRMGEKQVDVRVSILPTVHGEKVVMRILDKTNLVPGLAYLGLDDYSYQTMRHAVEQPHGIILVTGPTGSGKTTTLYSCLQDLNKDDVNIVTAEDPVEYELPGVNQVHVNVAQGLTFAGVLRSVLRQDPDIVLVGEIRDNETADIAVKAALTGHLVLSTLHTNDACGVVPRLIDMEVPPFLLASSLLLAQAQRLYRKLCPYCKREVAVDTRMLEMNGVDPVSFEGARIYGPGGCPKCNGLGYKGRGAFMEVLPISDEVRQIIERGGDAMQLKLVALKEGMVTLKESGMMRVREGVTSLEAAFAVTGGE